MNEKFVESAHTPPHLFRPNSIYIITAAIYAKLRLINTDAKKRVLVDILFRQSARLSWELEARSILPNNYHFIARAPENSPSLSTLIQAIHSISAKYLNRADNMPGRRVWYNYWDTCITKESSYLARLHYVHVNPSKHGYVDRPEDYEFSSYSWFLNTARVVFREKVFAQPIRSNTRRRSGMSSSGVRNLSTAQASTCAMPKQSFGTP